MSKIKKNYPLADETTFKVGGPAEFFISVDCRHELTDAIIQAEKMEVPVTIIGGGSNVIIPSEGINGLVVKLRGGNINFLGKNLLRVGAGVSLPRLSRFAFEESFRGLEWAMGVPGTLGGAIYGNAGAFGDSISDVVEEVEVLKSRKREVISADEIDFSYRSSTFKKEGLTILSASLRLKNGDKKEIKRKTDQYLSYRNENHPMEASCAGSVFKNPETTVTDDKILEEYPQLEHFNEKGVLSAGFLIEKAEMKGFSVGAAKVSEKHANFIINKDNEARSEDVKSLISKIQKRVEEKFGVILKREVRFLE